MVFDASVHRETLRLIEVARQLRRDKGLSEERNVSILHQEGAAYEGKEVVKFTSKKVNHLPAPHEMQNDNGKFIVPRKDCPQCGRKEGLSLKAICPSCTDSENGKYHTMYSCEEMGPEGKPLGCGFKTEKSEKFPAQIISEENPDWEGGMKKDLGIKTHTDNGIK